MKTVKITFTDHFLNTFDGSQEELDSIVEELKQKFSSGEFKDLFDPLDNDITIGTGDEEDLHQAPRVLH